MTLNEVWNELIDEVIIQIKTGVTELQDELIDNGFDSLSVAQGTGNLIAMPFTGLQPGDFIDSMDLNIVTVSGGAVRVKLYSDLSGLPDQLLTESESITLTTTGLVNFRFPKQLEVPSDGLVWGAFEVDTSTTLRVQNGIPSGLRQFMSHAYGTGPTTFVSAGTGTTGVHMVLHLKPKIVKHYGMRGSQPEDYFGIVAAGNMETGSYTSRGSINKFEIMVDISYRGVDFRDGLTKILKVASDIYDLLHRTTLNGKVRQCDVTTMNPAEIEEGKNLYLTGVRITLMCEKAVIQV